MPKAKSNKNNSLKRQIASLKREVNPLIVVRPVKGNPKPCNINRSVYVSRTVQLVKESASSAASLTRNDLIGSVNSMDTRIDFIKVWNTVPGHGMKATLYTSRVIDASAVPKDIQGEDYGNNASLAGLKFDIPMTLASDITEGATSDVLVGVMGGGATDKILFQVGLRIAV